MEDQELHQLVKEISITAFGKPFRHRAYFNPKLRTTGGRYLLGSHDIEVNKKYLLQLGESELIGIIKHELCHYHLHLEGRGYRHGDRDFKYLLQTVDAPRFCGHLHDTLMKKRSSKKAVLYECSHCHMQYQRKRKIDTSKYVCGKCRGKLMKIKEWSI